MTVASVARQDVDHPAAGTGALRFPGSRRVVVVPIRPPPPVVSFIISTSGAPCQDRIGLLTVLLATGLDPGLRKVAEASNIHDYFKPPALLEQ